MTPLVSILIPAFNAAPWIDASLESALRQTHPKIQVIVVDDGSSDETLTRARTFIQRGVRVMSQSNAGASSARNHALRHADGDFIQFLDADDLLSPRKLELQLALLATRPPGTLATCRWGRFETDPAAARFADHDVFRDFPPVEWLLHHTAGVRMMHPAAWLVPRGIVERAGPWDESLSLNDDGEYFARVAAASAGLAFASEPEAATYYRSGLAGSLSRRRSPAALASLYRSAELISTHLLSMEDSPRSRQALSDYWCHLCYEFYPDSPRLSREAGRRSATLGRSEVPPPLGSRARLLARLVGWRLARRLAARR